MIIPVNHIIIRVHRNAFTTHRVRRNAVKTNGAETEFGSYTDWNGNGDPHPRPGLYKLSLTHRDSPG